MVRGWLWRLALETWGVHSGTIDESTRLYCVDPLNDGMRNYDVIIH